MGKVEIFDPAMCCSTGVCGPGVDPELLRVATIINSLQKAGQNIIRHNLADEPDVYVKNSKVNAVLMEKGVDALPVTLVDDEIALTGEYPSNEQLISWSGASMKEVLDIMVGEEIRQKSCCSPEEYASCCGDDAKAGESCCSPEEYASCCGDDAKAGGSCCGGDSNCC